MWGCILYIWIIFIRFIWKRFINIVYNVDYTYNIFFYIDILLFIWFEYNWLFIDLYVFLCFCLWEFFVLDSERECVSGIILRDILFSWESGIGLLMFELEGFFNFLGGNLIRIFCFFGGIFIVLYIMFCRVLKFICFFIDNIIWNLINNC